MNAWKMALFFILTSGHLMAQDQMALRLNEKGLMKILKMAVQYNASVKGSHSLAIPQDIYKFTLPKSKLSSNPIVSVVNQISDLNLNRNLDFYFHTSEINVTGNVDQNSLKSKISNSSEKGFDLSLSLNLPRIVITGENLSLCEDKQNGRKACGRGLKASLRGLRLTTTGRPVKLTVVLRIRTEGQAARVTVRSVSSNLEGKNSPGLNVHFRSIDVPRIAVVVDGQETELDTSKLRDEILKRKSFLGKKLMSFAADFIAGDVAEMLNVYLVNKEIATSYQVFSQNNNPVKFDEFLSYRERYAVQDATFVRRPVAPSIRRQEVNPVSAMMAQISDVIRSAQAGISLRKISTPGNKDIELSGIINFILNNRRINVNNKLGNSSRVLPALNLNAQRNYDINLAISEPLLNGALDLANSTGLFQEIFEAVSPVEGFSVRNVKLHFAGTSALVAVVNAQVDLKKLKSKGIKDWFENKIAAWLERENNNSVIYFPIEVAVIPVFKKLLNGGTALYLKVLSPFNSNGLLNRFRYPTNVPDMTEIVKSGVMDELKTSLEPHTNKVYNIDLSKFLNQSGVVFLPRTIEINQGAYLMMNLDIVDIKFNSKNPTQR